MNINRLFYPLSGAFFMLLASANLLANEEAKEKPAKLVSVSKAKQEEISPSLWLPGDVVSRQIAGISAEQSGRLLWILDVGEKVNQGEAIAQLESEELNLELAEIQADYQQQQATVSYLEKQEKRLTSLLSNHSTARNELDKTSRDLQIARQQSKKLQLQMQKIQLRIDKSVIKAPFTGKINQRFAQQGEFITLGSLLVQLVDPESLDIKIAAPLSVAPYLQQGNSMLVKWENSLRNLPIRSWSPAGSQTSRTFEVMLDAAGLKLMSGNAVSVSLPKDQATLATLVPRDALILREKNTYVVTVDNEKLVRRNQVEVGNGIGDWVSVSGNVSAGDSVVIRGGESLQDGQKVRFDQTDEAVNVARVASN